MAQCTSCVFNVREKWIICERYEQPRRESSVFEGPYRFDAQTRHEGSPSTAPHCKLSTHPFSAFRCVKGPLADAPVGVDAVLRIDGGFEGQGGPEEVLGGSPPGRRDAARFVALGAIRVARDAGHHRVEFRIAKLRRGANRVVHDDGQHQNR